MIFHSYVNVYQRVHVFNFIQTACVLFSTSPDIVEVKPWHLQNMRCNTYHASIFLDSTTTEMIRQLCHVRCQTYRPTNPMKWKKQYFFLFDCCTFGFMNLDTIYNTISKKIGIGKNPTNICSQQKNPKQRKKMMHMDFFYGGSAKPWVSTLKWSTVMWIIWRCPRLFEKTWKEACAVSFTPSWACNRRQMWIDLCCHPCADLDMLDELSVLTFISTNLITALTARP